MDREHSTRSIRSFVNWIPEVNPLLFEHFKVLDLSLTVEKDGVKAVFRYIRPAGLGRKNRVFLVSCENCSGERYVKALEEVDFIDEMDRLRVTPLNRPAYACPLCGSEDIIVVDEADPEDPKVVENLAMSELSRK